MNPNIIDPSWRAGRIALPAGIPSPIPKAFSGAPSAIFSGAESLIHPPRWRVLPLGPEKPPERQP
jgi:hypothetical protein